MWIQLEFVWQSQMTEYIIGVRSMDNPVISPEKKSWDADAVYKPTVVLNKQKNKLLMWYNGRKQNCERIGLAEYRIK